MWQDRSTICGKLVPHYVEDLMDSHLSVSFGRASGYSFRSLWAEGIVYDPASGCIYKHRERIKLYPKSNTIMKTLMEAENHQLYGADLLAIAWGADETNIDKLYTQNSIIRKNLRKLGNEFRLENIEGGYFKLVFPNASKMKKR